MVYLQFFTKTVENMESKQEESKCTDDKKSNLQGEELIKSVQHFFYQDDEFANSFQQFANENCDVFDDEKELKLEYTELHKQFVAMFESKMSGIFLLTCFYPFSIS